MLCEFVVVSYLFSLASTVTFQDFKRSFKVKRSSILMSVSTELSEDLTSTDTHSSSVTITQRCNTGTRF